MTLRFGDACVRCHGSGKFNRRSCVLCGGTGLTRPSQVEHDEGVREGRERRDEAVARVDRNASLAWKRQAEDAAISVARSLPEFTTDDVWRVLRAGGVVEPHEPRAMGPVMMSLRRKKIIVATEHFTTTARPVAHAAPIRIWKSLLYGRR